LIEAYLGMLPVIYYDSIDRVKWKTNSFHIVRFSILGILFCVAVGGASLRIIRPKVTTITHSGTNERLVGIVEKQQNQINEALSNFSAKDQKTNSAIAFKSLTEVGGELREAVKSSDKNDFTGDLIDVIAVICIRFILQAANVFCFWNLGYALRQLKIKLVSFL